MLAAQSAGLMECKASSPLVASEGSACFESLEEAPLQDKFSCALH